MREVTEPKPCATTHSGSAPPSLPASETVSAARALRSAWCSVAR